MSLPDAAKKFVPDEERLLSLVQTLAKDEQSDLSDLLRSMDRLTSLIEFYQGSEDTVLIFLSLPWLQVCLFMQSTSPYVVLDTEQRHSAVQQQSCENPFHGEASFRGHSVTAGRFASASHRIPHYTL